MFFAGAIVVIGWVAGALIYKGQRELTDGLTKKMMKWLLGTVLGCGFPYAMWNFLLYAEVIPIQSTFLRELPGNLLMALFFVMMLRTGMIVKKMGSAYGFTSQLKRMKDAKK